MIQVVLCRKGMAIQDGTVGFFGDREFTPIAPYGVFALAQGDGVGLPIGMGGVKAPIPAADGARLKSPAASTQPATRTALCANLACRPK